MRRTLLKMAKPKKTTITSGIMPVAASSPEISAISVTKSGQLALKLWCKPGAKTSSISGFEEGAIGLRIGAAAREGEANEELIEFMANILGLKKRQLSLDKGSKSRQKVLLAEGITMDAALSRVRANIQVDI
eukprot:TRINITY_DN2179_c0_g1::TRINITY_DN2179_c0_g1_i1::g.12782::m.12782 TRINITY_DN2179_c0_g1::TRINITY_DN2179_c0_g1_i1::g.12782  ORF type:complete len:132 (+),score=1.74,sp/Q8WUR7/CO040_HUMAN/35.37/2e-12,DUF167/PF02594.11/1.8e-19 TRINITY_DN2179_c0_g1_i1:69-464(+)